MTEMWLQEYIFLAFRIHKVVQTAYGSPFVEYYYGPPLWREQVEAEPEMKTSDLVRQAMILANALPAQGFTANRAIYLSKNVKAMETLCRKLCKETFSLAEEVKYCLDIQLTWTSEDQFELAHTLYDSVLPGSGSITERLQTYRAAIACPPEQTDLLTRSINLAFVETRKRTHKLIPLPEEEAIDIECLPEWEYDAAAYYQGNYRTHIMMNVAATSAHLSRLFDHKVCHEGYPGHHTEYVLKEQLLYRERGYVEQAIGLTLCPQRVIEEGIAQVAHEIIFAEGEAEQWLVEHVYHAFQKEVDATVLLRLRQASEMLGKVWDNAALLLNEGQSEQAVARYFTTFMLLTPERATQMVAHLQHPIWGRNELTYASGQKLVSRWLQGPDRTAVFQRLLKEQWTPSQLEGNVLSAQN